MLGKMQVDTEWSRLVEVERHGSRGGDRWVMLTSGQCQSSDGKSSLI